MFRRDCGFDRHDIVCQRRYTYDQTCLIIAMIAPTWRLIFETNSPRRTVAACAAFEVEQPLKLRSLL